MKLYCGIDLHSNNNVNVIINETGEVVSRKKLANDLNLVLRFLESFKGKMQGVVIESTFNWYWLVDGLEAAGFIVLLANTAAIQQYSGLKHSDDNSDALWLAEMLRLDVLPVGYIYPKELRTTRDLMRKRMQLVQQSTSNLLAIQGIYMRHQSYRLSNNDIKRLTNEQVEKDCLAENVAHAVKSNLAVMNCLQENIKSIEKSLLQQVKLDPEFLQLTSIDGIGNILALTIMLETGDIKRFSKAGNYASYCRCISGARYSNGKKKGKTNAKNGNKFLAWAFVEAAGFAIRYNKTVKAYYQRKMAKTNQIIAIKTVAHKLARACFYVLRDQVPFDVQKAFS
jgi:transposase